MLNGETNGYMVTISTYNYGPYDTYEKAIFAALINFGFDGWTITRTKE